MIDEIVKSIHSYIGNGTGNGIKTVLTNHVVPAMSTI